MDRLDQNDPRYPVILEQAREMVNSRFDMIPSVLFANAADSIDDMDSWPLMLVGSDRRVCQSCGEEVEEGDEIKCKCDGNLCNCILDELDDRFAGNHHWKCDSCEQDSESFELAYEDLEFSGPRYGGWPAAHYMCFWTTEWPKSFRHELSTGVIESPGIVAAGVQAGFLVYEPREFDGYVLAVDGGGYDFYEAHWVPLYLALKLKWHERTEQWQDALKAYDRHKRQRLNSKE